MLLSTSLAITSVLLNCAFATVPPPLELTIQTRQGQVRGVHKVARNWDNFAAFYGIPYAQPPLGELRFAPPLPHHGWNDIRDASVQANECLQNRLDMPSITTGDEDCLYLNIFTKHPGNSNAKRKVLVWVHGGAFIFGGAKIYDPSYIMEEDVVLVVIQYRLNIFGFLSMENSDLPGNYGSLDQVQALRWVKENIASYGGDPEDVTVFGMSAGGASVHYLVMSPQTHGLFKNAIAFSGSALNWWANIPSPKIHALRLAKHLGCEEVARAGNVAKCLRSIPAADIIEAHKIFFDWKPEFEGREPMNLFSPCSDPESSDPFLPESPIVTMQKGNVNKVPLMLGYTEKEGIWRANYIAPDHDGGQEWREFMSKFDELGPLAFGLTNQTENPRVVLDEVINFYQLKNLETPTERDMHNYIDAQSDTMFNFGIDVTAKLLADKIPTFHYFLKFPIEHSLANFRHGHTIARPHFEALKLASHGADMLLLFPMFPFPPLAETDLRVSREFIKLVLDFGDNGKVDRHPQWTQLDLNNPKVLVIDEKTTVQDGLPFQDRMAFWQKFKVYWNNTTPKVDMKNEL